MLWLKRIFGILPEIIWDHELLKRFPNAQYSTAQNSDIQKNACQFLQSDWQVQYTFLLDIEKRYSQAKEWQLGDGF